jgi:hypothetical protein
MDTLEFLDAQISSLEIQLAQLKRRRNRLIPICRLPFELLIHILKLIQRPIDAFRVDYMTYSWEPFHNSWRNLVTICASIREKVMDSVDIWAAVDVHSADIKWLEYCKQRAGDVPLTIRAVRAKTFGFRAASDSVHIFASKNLSRARAVYLRPEGVGLRVLQAALHRRNPLLRALDYDGPGKFKWTPKFLGGACDQLQKLVLSNIEIEGTVPLPSLRHLSLIKFSFGEENLLPFYDVLSKAPNLETLYLNPQSEYPRHPTEFPEYKTIPMPFLRKIELCAVTARLAQSLLRVLATPTEELKLVVTTGPRAALEALWQSITPLGRRFTTKLTTKGQQSLSNFSDMTTETTIVPNGMSRSSVFITAAGAVHLNTLPWHNIHVLSLVDDRGSSDISFLMNAMLLPDLQQMIVHDQLNEQRRGHIEAWLKRNHAVAVGPPHISFSRACDVDIVGFGEDLQKKGLVRSFEIVSL